MFYGVISIHALLAESDWYNLHTTRGLEISIHALLAESDATNAETAAKAAQFLSTLSLRRATTIHSPTHSQRYNFYPRSPCGERHRPCDYTSPLTYISIHALLAESDWCISRKTPVQAAFLSTLSLRRATRHKTRKFIINVYFYPRSPCGERQKAHRQNRFPPRFLSTLSLRRATTCRKRQPICKTISIHALLAESDKYGVIPQQCGLISIHALLAESDKCSIPLRGMLRNFYPRSPCGERRRTKTIATKISHFYPRSPCGERLRGWTLNINGPIFLSTLSLRRATTSWYVCSIAHTDFYPRSPCGERLNAVQIVIVVMYFYPRSPCGERRLLWFMTRPRSYFYPRSPCGERRYSLRHSAQNWYFYPRSPCGERRL